MYLSRHQITIAENRSIDHSAVNDIMVLYKNIFCKTLRILEIINEETQNSVLLLREDPIVDREADRTKVKQKAGKHEYKNQAKGNRSDTKLKPKLWKLNYDKCDRDKHDSAQEHARNCDEE